MAETTTSALCQGSVTRCPTANSVPFPVLSHRFEAKAPREECCTHAFDRFGCTLLMIGSFSKCFASYHHPSRWTALQTKNVW